MLKISHYKNRRSEVVIMIVWALVNFVSCSKTGS